MKKYEAMYIIRPELDEEQRKAVMEEVNATFTSHASVVSEVKEWGLRDLAYEVAKCTKGYYVLLNVEATVEAVNEFNRVCNIKEAIIRHIIVSE